MSLLKEKAEFLTAEANEYELKSMKVVCKKVETSIIE